MSNPNNQDATKAAILAMVSLAGILAGAQTPRKQGPTPEVVTA